MPDLANLTIRDNPDTKQREALDSHGRVYAVIDKAAIDDLNRKATPEELRAFATEKQMPFPLTPWGAFAPFNWSLDAARERALALPQNKIKSFNGVIDEGTQFSKH